MRTLIEIDAVLNLIGELCPECQSKIRGRISVNHQEMNISRQERLKCILVDVARQHCLETEEMFNRSHSSSIVAARRRFAEVAKQSAYSHDEIAAILKRHRSTITNLLHPKGHHAQAKAKNVRS